MNASKDDVALAVRSIWERRDDRYSVERSSLQASKTKVEMSFIGG
jgi:cyclic pyranopterin phosphate synthase